ncbi:hypothetical protein B0H17DRAFT_1135204 [Mycena rosella]|uniref:Uncharacterized protein n=1 Tax=Mycena rosella TaxID=1033263 RepID=A0AAD7DDM1_MYCRO|nr:hypothetical protein B0H17DRAFT_1135204 [Mycena rosella]
MPLSPVPTKLAKIVNGDNLIPIPSRIPVVIEALWDSLLANSELGRALRKPFWLPFNDYEDIEFRPATDIPLLSENADYIGFTPTGPDKDHENEPTICFDPSFHDIVESVRIKVISSFSPDDVAELWQLDFLTSATFLHELGHVIRRARWPRSICPPERFKAGRVNIQAKEGQGEGGELIERVLWGGLINMELVDFSGIQAAKGLFYGCWDHQRNLVPDYETSDGEEDDVDDSNRRSRYLCLWNRVDSSGNTELQYLTRAGAARMGDAFLGHAHSDM